VLVLIAKEEYDDPPGGIGRFDGEKLEQDAPVGMAPQENVNMLDARPLDSIAALHSAL
jgi:hypothetical protein